VSCSVILVDINVQVDEVAADLWMGASSLVVAASLIVVGHRQHQDQNSSATPHLSLNLPRQHQHRQ
jgi:hypothetical protein